MSSRTLRFPVLGIAVALVLSACGGGGGCSPAIRGRARSSSRRRPSGPNSFLLFPNPQVQPDGTLQTNTVGYAQAYYARDRPATTTRDTLAKWKAVNGFDTGTGTRDTAWSSATAATSDTAGACTRARIPTARSRSSSRTT